MVRYSSYTHTQNTMCVLLTFLKGDISYGGYFALVNSRVLPGVVIPMLKYYCEKFADGISQRKKKENSKKKSVRRVKYCLTRSAIAVSMSFNTIVRFLLKIARTYLLFQRIRGSSNISCSTRNFRVSSLLPSVFLRYVPLLVTGPNRSR